MADLSILQELLGFPEQEIFEVEGNQYRNIAMHLQLGMMTIEDVRQLIVGQSKRVVMEKQVVAENWFN